MFDGQIFLSLLSSILSCSCSSSLGNNSLPSLESVHLHAGTYVGLTIAPSSVAGHWGEVGAQEKGESPPPCPQLGVLLLQTSTVPLAGGGHGSYTLGEDRHKMNRCCTEGIFIPTCHTSVCVYYRCRCNYLSLKRSTILCQKKRKKKMMLLLSQLWSGHNASIKASGKKGNILKVKEYFRMDKLEVIFNTGVSVMMLYCMRKIHSSPRHSC